MKEKLKNQNGIAFIAVILILVVAVAAGGATYLGVRMLVTGESFLAPFEELGWIDSGDKDDEDDEDEIVAKDDKNDKDNKDDEDVTTNYDRDNEDKLEDRLSSVAKEKGVDHYYGKMTMAESENLTPEDEEYELYEALTMEVDIYAKDDKAVEIVFTVNMKDMLRKLYDQVSEEGDGTYSTYEEFEDAMIPYLEDSFDMGFKSSADENSEIYDYIQTYKEDGIIQVFITEEGFDDLYESYGITDESTINTIIDSIEDRIGITIKKVK